MTTRRRFLTWGLGLLSAVGLGSLAGGCTSARMSAAAQDPGAGTPYRCETCGYLTRSKEDLSDERCPRCWNKAFKQVDEKTFAEELAKE